MEQQLVRSPGKMRVMASFEAAIQHAKRVLFRPFDFTTWMCFGVIVFLDQLFSTKLNLNVLNSGSYSRGGGDFGQSFIEFERWAGRHMDTIIFGGLPVIVVLIAFGVFINWISSRGQMMLIRAVALNDHDIATNWRETKTPAWSLFVFRLILSVVTFLVFIPLLVGAYLSLRGLAHSDHPGGFSAYLLALLPYVAVFVLLAVATGLVWALQRSFVSPLMFHRGLSWMEGWAHFREILRGNVLAVLGYFGLRIVYGVAFGLASTLAGCLTCCIGFLPVVHHALFAPYYVFDRAFSLFVLRSLGPDYDMIAPETPPALPEEVSVPELR